MNDITHISEQPYDYTHALTAADTLPKLRALLEEYKSLASDALEAIPSEEEFPEFRKGLRAERRGKFAGQDWSDRYGCILLPEVLYRVSLVAQQYHVPWGLAFLRLKEVGRIHINLEGIASWNNQA